MAMFNSYFDITRGYGMSSFPNHRPQHGPGLWDLASAAGQRVNFTALENKVVAVDAAWATKMGDEAH